MVLYAVIMFAVAALLVVFGALIYRGRTHLIHDYHRTRVKDEKAYGRAFGKALSGMAIAPAACGVLALCEMWDVGSAVLFVGLAISIVFLYRVQKKHNGGMF